MTTLAAGGSGGVGGNIQIYTRYSFGYTDPRGIYENLYKLPKPVICGFCRGSGTDTEFCKSCGAPRNF